MNRSLSPDDVERITVKFKVLRMKMRGAFLTLEMPRNSSRFGSIQCLRNTVE